jgi:hypothetical protein
MTKAHASRAFRHALDAVESILWGFLAGVACTVIGLFLDIASDSADDQLANRSPET